MTEKRQTTAEVLEDIERRVAEHEAVMTSEAGQKMPKSIGRPGFTYEDVAFLLNLLHGLYATTTIEAARAPEAT